MSHKETTPMEPANPVVNVNVLLFDGFETLDVFGPVEIIGRLQDHYRVRFYSLKGGMIRNQHGVEIATFPLDQAAAEGILLIPGGPGVRTEVVNGPLLNAIRQLCEQSRYVLTVCTGSALLAATGLLNGRKATSNKRAFDWVARLGKGVEWIRAARWTTDGKFYTSSGVSAGMDMTLGFLRDIHGIDFARRVARHIEYRWQEDHTLDPFVSNSADSIT